MIYCPIEEDIVLDNDCRGCELKDVCTKDKNTKHDTIVMIFDEARE